MSYHYPRLPTSSYTLTSSGVLAKRSISQRWKAHWESTTSPYGSETVYQAPKAAPAPSAKAPRKFQDHRLTVERLFELGVISTQTQPELLELKAIFDDQIKVATDELQRIPFAISSQRILNTSPKSSTSTWINRHSTRN